MKLGIDFGTCYSFVATMLGTDVRTTLLDDADTSTGVPTLFMHAETDAAHPDGNYYGRDAYNKRMINPSACIKEIKKDIRIHPERIAANTSHRYRLGGRDYTAEEIVTLILKHLINTALTNARAQNINGSNSVDEITITAPVGLNGMPGAMEATALYNEMLVRAAMQATGIRDAAKVHILGEPVAAAMYNIHKNKSSGKQTILVYDLGGGTFDAAIVEYDPTGNRYSAVATGGYTDVGGGDWDNCLKKVVYDNLKSDRKIGDRVDSVLTLTPDNGYMPRNADICSTYERRIVTAKIHFSDPYNDDALLSFTDGDVVYKTCVSRDEFERESRTLLEKTMVIVDDVISAFESYKKIGKGQGINHIDRIVMVGGASRMLQVKRELERKFRGKIIYLDDPQLAIAAGAALNNDNVVAIRQRVQHTYGIGTNTTVDVSEYNSHRSERYIDYDNNRQLTDKYWVQTVGSETIYKKRGVSNIIIKGTEIDPRQGYVEASSTFYPLDDNQTQVAFYVYISETHNAWSDYESPQLFGYTIDVPASYRGRARQFEVTAEFRITIDGVVVLTTRDRDGNEIRHGRYPE